MTNHPSVSQKKNSTKIVIACSHYIQRLAKKTIIQKMKTQKEKFSNMDNLINSFVNTITIGDVPISEFNDNDNY